MALVAQAPGCGATQALWEGVSSDSDSEGDQRSTAHPRQGGHLIVEPNKCGILHTAGAPDHLEPAALGSYEVVGYARVEANERSWLDIRLRRLAHT